jgi:hypothetical protein
MREITDDRTPTDGLPFYCCANGCNQPYDGRHCERLDCQLESVEAAQARAADER